MSLIRPLIFTFAILVFGIFTSVSVDAAEGWRVQKSSGDVWVASNSAQPVSLGNDQALRPGDSISTGKNGRVLLVRGEETILIAPNSVVALPTEQKKELSTTILQQAGSILLKVEKRNVKHFEVETPYLAAVVKGTQFRVSVDQFGTNVDVVQGKVEVADFKSGQFALVLPGQSAKVLSDGPRGLTLRGEGKLSPIQQGAPRKATIQRVNVPASGLKAPNAVAPGQKIKALKATDGQSRKKAAAVKPGKPQFLAVKPKLNKAKKSRTTRVNRRSRRLRISAPIGQVKLNFQKATKGLARANTNSRVSASNAKKNGAAATIWNGGNLANAGVATAGYKSNNKSNGIGAAVSGAVSNAGGNGNGNGGAAGGAVGAAASALGGGNALLNVPLNPGSQGQGQGLGLGLNK